MRSSAQELRNMAVAEIKVDALCMHTGKVQMTCLCFADKQ